MKKLIFIALLFGGCDYAPTEHTHTDTLKHGCLDGQATNYDATASIDNNTCTYIDSCGVVDIDLTNDCTKDECGVWGGDGVLDNCEICDADASNDCVQDCLGVWGGSAEYVDCIPGTYTLTTQSHWNNSDCSGSGENDLDGSFELQLILNSDGSGWYLISFTDSVLEPSPLLLFWTLNGDQVTITFDYNENGIIDEDETSDSFSATFTEGSLKSQNGGVSDGYPEGYCFTIIFTKI